MQELELKDMHCLIVDDESTFVYMFRGMLKMIGVGKVTTAKGAAEAFRLLAASPHVDVILCDLKMDAGNGLELLKAVRTGQIKTVRSDTCFIMVSAITAHGRIKEAAELDVNGYLVKPLSLDKLKRAIAVARGRQITPDTARYAQVIVPEHID